MAYLQWWFLFLVSIQCALGLNLTVTNFTQCEKPMQYIQFSFKTKSKGSQLYSLDYKSPVENGANFRMEVVVKILRGTRWQKLITIKDEDGTCAAMFKYAGEMVGAALDNLGEPRRCPFRKGTMRFRDLPFNIGKAQLMPLPRGKISMLIKSFEKSTGNLGVCIYAEAESL